LTYRISIALFPKGMVYRMSFRVFEILLTQECGRLRLRTLARHDALCRGFFPNKAITMPKRRVLHYILNLFDNFLHPTMSYFSLVEFPYTSAAAFSFITIEVFEY